MKLLHAQFEGRFLCPFLPLLALLEFGLGVANERPMGFEDSFSVRFPFRRLADSGCKFLFLSTHFDLLLKGCHFAPPSFAYADKFRR